MKKGCIALLFLLFIGSLHAIQPTQEPSKSSRWMSVSSNGNYSVALKKDGTLWAFKTTKSKKSLLFITMPKQIGIGHNWVSASSGRTHALAVKKDGTLWAWGRDIRDGVKHKISSMLPIKITQSSDWVVAHTHGDSYTLALKKDGTLWGWGTIRMGKEMNLLTPKQITKIHDWERVSIGRYNIVACKADGTLWAWGENTKYINQNIFPTNLTSNIAPRKITLLPMLIQEMESSGMIISLRDPTQGGIIKENGSLWIWRRIDSKEILIEEPTKSSDWKSVCVKGNRVLAIKKEGTLWFWTIENKK